MTDKDQKKTVAELVRTMLNLVVDESNIPEQN